MDRYSEKERLLNNFAIYKCIYSNILPIFSSVVLIIYVLHPSTFSFFLYFIKIIQFLLILSLG